MNNENKISERQNDFVINHTIEDAETSRKIIEKFNKRLYISKRRQENAKLDSAILPPTRISQLFPWLDYKDLLHPPVTLTDVDPPHLHTEVSSEPPTLTPTQSPSSNVTGSPSKLSSNSPLKFNKAVSGFRTPKKDESKERNIELQNKVSRNIFSESDLFYSDEDSSIDSAVSGILLRAQEEVKICRIWFNANKMFKVRELSTQTTQYYDQTTQYDQTTHLDHTNQYDQTTLLNNQDDETTSSETTAQTDTSDNFFNENDLYATYDDATEQSTYEETTTANVETTTGARFAL